MRDNRKELLTVTMTREEWDVALGRGRTYSNLWEPEETLRELVRNAHAALAGAGCTVTPVNDNAFYVEG